MRVIIAGSRGITDYAVVRQAVIDSGLWALHKRKLEVVCGMAKGVDMLGLQFAKRNKLGWHEFPALWDDLFAPGAVVRKTASGRAYNARAGHDRNELMARIAHGLVAIWDGKSTGTKDMIDRAYAHELFVYIHKV